MTDPQALEQDIERTVGTPRRIASKPYKQSAANFEQLLLDILRVGMNLVEATDAAIGLLEGDKIKFKYALGRHATVVERHTISIGEGLTGRAVAEKRIMCVDDVTLDKNHQFPIKDVRSELDVPIVVDNQLIGVLNFESPHVGEFGRREEEIAVDFAALAASAILNQRQMEAAIDMALIGDVTTGLLHDVSNQVSLLRALSYDIENAEDDTKREELPQRFRDECDRVLNKIAYFRNQYKIDISEGGPINLRQAIQEVVAEAPISESTNIGFDLQDVPDQIEVKAHLEQLRAVIRNLAQNSITAMPNGGEVKFSALRENSFAVLRVKDQGVGIDRDDWVRVFDRGYTTKRTALGTKGGGIGLWWCERYLTRIGGRIQVEDSALNKGTTFRLDIPLSKEDEV